jgi:hypothetical protein
MAGRAPRSTRATILEAEAVQAEVIASLSSMGAATIAARLARCQSTRLWRHQRWRCGSAGCWACRRTALRDWWGRIQAWATPAASLIVLPADHDPGKIVQASRRLRRSVRDVRDRHARDRRAWRFVAAAGIVTDDRAYLLVDGIDGGEAVQVFSRRWPGMMLGQNLDVPPWTIAVEDAVQLALVRRGIQPIRLTVLEQRDRTSVADASTAFSDVFLDPMPMIF